jgi:predicted GNAT family N-acyltransferase
MNNGGEQIMQHAIDMAIQHFDSTLIGIEAQEYCRVGINDEGNLTMPKTEPKEKVTKAIEVS